MTTSDTWELEKFLELPDGRTLAYEANGNAKSKSVILYLHGTMTVGDASNPPANGIQKDMHFVAPTLPGWGQTSPRPPGVPFHAVVRRDTTALLNHLHPTMATDPEYKLYVAGGSYGSVPAQIVYGSSLEDFPMRDRIVGVLIMGGFCPFYKMPDWGNHMTTANYLSMGPFAYNSPFKVVPRMMAWGIGMQVSTPEKATAFLKGFLFDKMTQEEKDFIVKRRGKSIEELTENMGRNTYRSMKKTIAGFVDMATAASADWGLRDEIFKSPDDPTSHFSGFPRVVVASSKDDTMAPFAFAEWNVANYKNGELLSISGVGHGGAVAYVNEIWDKFLGTE